MKSVLRYLLREMEESQKLGKVFFLFALALAQGAPIGHILLTSAVESVSPITAVRENVSNLIYIWLGTTVVFSLFGYVMGSFAEVLIQQDLTLRQSQGLMRNFGKMKYRFLRGMNERLLTPLATSIEFLEGLKDEDFGPLNDDQRKLAQSSFEELRGFYENFQSLLSYREEADQRRNFVSIAQIKSMIEDEFVGLTMEFTVGSETQLPVPRELFLQSLKRIVREIRLIETDLSINIQISQPQNLKFEGYPQFVYFIIDVYGSSGKIPNEDISWLISRNVFEWHGGFLWHDEDYENGTRLYIALPKIEEELARGA